MSDFVNTWHELVSAWQAAEDMRYDDPFARPAMTRLARALLAFHESELVPPSEPAVEKDYFYLCCNCGEITAFADWTAWQRDEETFEWRPSRPGEGDPMLRCPSCKWEHVDDDSNPGIYDGTREQMEAERARLVARDGEFDKFTIQSDGRFAIRCDGNTVLSLGDSGPDVEIRRSPPAEPATEKT